MMLLPNLAERSHAPELMDSEPVSFEAFEKCLVDLAWLNRLFFSYRLTEKFVARALRRSPGRPLALLDVASGYGDMLRRLHRKFGSRLELVGVDLNPSAARAAMKATPPGVPIRYETADVFRFAAGRRFDLIISSQFTHHLDNDALVRFLRWMEDEAALGWFVSDLHRHVVPYAIIKGLPRLVRLDRMVVHDGPISVARAFVRRDWTALIRRAGLDPAAVSINWRLFRYGVGRLK
jgi:SAM-dependent methyltransferase